MKPIWFVLPLIGIALTGCDRQTNMPSTDSTRNVDNTGQNVRDRDMQTLTPGNQSESEVDRTITQNIRKALMDDQTLSTNAKNIKIITVQRVVTLRGVVNSDSERATILKKAKQFADTTQINDQLEVIKG